MRSLLFGEPDLSESRFGIPTQDPSPHSSKNRNRREAPIEEHFLAALHDFRMDPYPWNMVNLKALFYYHPEWLIPSIAVVALVSWYVIYQGSLEVSLAAVLIGGVLINPHTTIADGTLILPAFLMATRAPLITLRFLATLALMPFYIFLPSGTFQVILITTLSLGARMIWQEARA